MKISAIYTITNRVNKKIYVGYTEDYNERICNHKNELKDNRHKNKHLQLSWNKHGAENFIFEILEECEVHFLVALEHYWCNMLNTHNPNKGYNIGATNPISKSSRPMLGKKHSLNSKAKISKNRKGKLIGDENPFYGKKHSKETKQKMSRKAIGKIVSEKARQNMSKAKKGKIPKNIEIFKNSMLGKKMSQEVKNKISEFQKIKIYQYDLQDNFIKEFPSAVDAAKHLGISYYSEINRCAKGTINKAHGYIWKRNL